MDLVDNMKNNENHDNGLSNQKPIVVIGLCGESGAGKSTTTELLRKLGFEAFSVSAMVREEVTELLGPDQPRLVVQDHARKKQEEEGPEYFAQRFLQVHDPFHHRYDRVVLDGIRNCAEVKELQRAVQQRRNGRFYLIGLETPQTVRYQRVLHRSRSGDPTSMELFVQADARASKHGGFQENHSLLKQADFRILNDGNLKDLERQIQDILDTIQIQDDGQPIARYINYGILAKFAAPAAITVALLALCLSKIQSSRTKVTKIS